MEYYAALCGDRFLEDAEAGRPVVLPGRGFVWLCTRAGRTLCL